MKPLLASWLALFTSTAALVHYAGPGRIMCQPMSDGSLKLCGLRAMDGYCDDTGCENGLTLDSYTLSGQASITDLPCGCAVATDCPDNCFFEAMTPSSSNNGDTGLVILVDNGLDDSSSAAMMSVCVLLAVAVYLI